MVLDILEGIAGENVVKKDVTRVSCVYRSCVYHHDFSPPRSPGPSLVPDNVLQQSGNTESGWQRPEYFDYAKACRAIALKFEKDFTKYHRGPECFHQDTLDIRDWLQKKAYGEIRSKVFLIAGTLLPLELTEQLFEHAMAAEEIPLDPSVWVSIRAPAEPAETRITGKDYHEQVRLKDLDKCRTLREGYRACRY